MFVGHLRVESEIICQCWDYIINEITC